MPWHDSSALKEDTQNWKVTVPVQWPPTGIFQGAFKFAETSVWQLGLSMKRSRQESVARSRHFGCPAVSFVREVVGIHCVTMCFRPPAGVSKADFLKSHELKSNVKTNGKC